MVRLKHSSSSVRKRCRLNLQFDDLNTAFALVVRLMDTLVLKNTPPDSCNSVSIYAGFLRRMIQFCNCPFAVPSQAPASLSLTVKISTSIEASWQLPPAEDRNGIITGFKLFYKKKGSSEPSTEETINGGSTLTKVVTGLDKYTEYEFEVLAFTSVGDGPKSSVESQRTMEDGKKVAFT